MQFKTEKPHRNAVCLTVPLKLFWKKWDRPGSVRLPVKACRRLRFWLRPRNVTFTVKGHSSLHEHGRVKSAKIQFSFKDRSAFYRTRFAVVSALLFLRACWGYYLSATHISQGKKLFSQNFFFANGHDAALFMLKIKFLQLRAPKTLLKFVACPPHSSRAIRTN